MLYFIDSIVLYCFKDYCFVLGGNSLRIILSILTPVVGGGSDIRSILKSLDVHYFQFIIHNRFNSQPVTGWVKPWDLGFNFSVPQLSEYLPLFSGSLSCLIFLDEYLWPERLGSLSQICICFCFQGNACGHCQGKLTKSRELILCQSLATRFYSNPTSMTTVQPLEFYVRF